MHTAAELCPGKSGLLALAHWLVPNLVFMYPHFTSGITAFGAGCFDTMTFLSSVVLMVQPHSRDDGHL